MASRSASVELLSPLAKLGVSKDLALDVREGRERNNKAIVEAFEKLRTNDEIHYRKTARPWDLVPQYAKKRVTDLCGVLTSEHRMEIEQTIDKMREICDVDFYVVAVPTVGFVTPRAFANSIFFDWNIGQGRGNGLLLLFAQHEATVLLVASPAIEEYFDTPFLRPAVDEIFTPLAKDGQPSLAIVQLVYAIARHAHEIRDVSRKGLLPLPVRDKVRFAAKSAVYGWYLLRSLVLGTLTMVTITVVLWSKILDAMCPSCGASMCRITRDDHLQRVLSKGHYLEHINGCSQFRVWKCARCDEGMRVVVTSRDLHHHAKCLQCAECKFHTATMEVEVVKLPTKRADGIKRVAYDCENCQHHREFGLPLYRPMPTGKETEWIDSLLLNSQQPKGKGLSAAVL